MSYGATAMPQMYRPSPVWHYAAAFIVVCIMHGVALHALWTSTEPEREPLIPLRMLARTLQLPAPVPLPAAPLARPAVPPPLPARPVEPPPKPAPVVVPKPAPKPEQPVVKPLAKPIIRPIEKPIAPPKASPTKMPTPVENRVQKPPVSDTPAAVPAPAMSPRESKVVAPPVVEVAAQYGAAYLQNPAPDYPMLSRRRREQGTVQLQVWVTSGGRAEKVEVVKSSGFERLDAVALATVKQWRFVPARRGEVPVASSVRVPIVFALN